MLSNDFWTAEAETMYTLVFPVSKDAADTAVESAVQMLVDQGVAFSEELVNEVALALAESVTLDLVTGITDTSRRLFQQYSTDWIASGEPLDVLLEQLAPVFGEVRAEAIAITEITRLFAMANNAAWEKSGFVGEVEIRTAEDDLVCEICSPLAGTRVRLGQSEGYPPYHVRCRCWEVPVIHI